MRNSAKLDSDYPLRVLYCGVFSLPTEYCEYMPDVAKCRQWLEKNFPNEFAKLTVENSPKQEAGISEGQGTVGEEEEKKKTKERGKRSNKTEEEDSATEVHNSQNSQSEEEICDEITGEDEVIIQGDFTDDIIDVIQEKWPEVDDDSIEDLGEVKK
ncbi:hypothetical protein ACRRTK_006063 [Alexandromys fortis]